MTLALNAAAAVDASGGHRNIVTIPDTAHGYQAGSLIYLAGTDNYNGLWNIDAVAANTFNIDLGAFKKFTAETFSSGDSGRPAFTYDEAFEFLGFELHLAAAGATSENFSIDVDAAKGAAWDTNLYSKDMNGVQDIVVNFDQPREFKANDLIVCTYTNTDGSNLWGLKLLARRIA
ncbi:MAG: hypothetical protein ACW99J_16170 [Candidatus Thorarchaeota archaeon]